MNGMGLVGLIWMVSVAIISLTRRRRAAFLYGVVSSVALGAFSVFAASQRGGYDLPFGWGGRQVAVVLLILLAGWAILGHIVAWKSRALGERDRWQAELEKAKDTRDELTVEITRLHREVDKGIFDLLAIYEFTTIVGGTLRLSDMANTLVDTILRLVRYDSAAFLLNDQTSGRLSVEAARGFTDEQARMLCDAPGEGVAGWAVKSQQPLVIADLGQQGPQGRSLWLAEAGYRSLLSMPLLVHGGVVGVLVMVSTQPAAYSQDDLRVLFIIANQAAFAVQNAQLFAEMAHLAITDGLTGLYNHRHFRTSIDQAVADATQRMRPLSMIMVDIDHFKGVNDRYGHQMGDQVLRLLSQVIQERVRTSDLVARYGGEEFAVLLPETGLDEAVAVAQRIHESIAGTDFGGVHITASFGVATYPSEYVRNRDELISAADRLTYQAKESGRNKVCALLPGAGLRGGPPQAASCGGGGKAS